MDEKIADHLTNLITVRRNCLSLLTEQGEIEAMYRDQHNYISLLYYNGESGLSKEEFDQFHSDLWDELYKSLIDRGFKSPPEVTTQ